MLSTLSRNAKNGLRRFSSEFKGMLDLEVGSLATFFSGDHPARGAVSVPRELVAEKDGRRELSYEVIYPDGRLRITETETGSRRVLRIEALDDSLVMDAVIRFVLPLNVVNAVALNETVIPWRRQNRYHQVERAIARIDFNDGSALQLRPFTESEGLPPGLFLMTYLRDEPEAWILHIRVRANKPTHFSTRGCVRWYNKPFPGWAQAVFRKIPGFYAATLLIRERVSQRIPCQTNGAVLLKRGAAFEFGVTWESY